MKQHSKATFIAFAALGGLLLASLILPIASLLVEANWVTWAAAWKEEGTRSALYVSLITSITATVIMTLLGVPLGYVLATAHPEKLSSRNILAGHVAKISRTGARVTVTADCGGVKFLAHVVRPHKNVLSQ